MINTLLPFLGLLLSSFVFSIPMIRSGLIYDFGVGFWGPNAHDGLWHIALIKQLKQNVPPLNPIFSGEVLTHYHWGFDLIAAWLDKIVPLSTRIIYFQLIPILFSLIIGFLSYLLAYRLTEKKFTAAAFTFLNYFAGSFGWMVTLIKSGSIGGESIFWSMQSISTLINPPFALSLIILFWGLLLWLKKRKKSNLLSAIVVGFLFGCLSFIKVYAGILIGLSLGAFWLLKVIRKENKVFDLVVPLSAGIISIIFLKLMGVLSSTSSLVFKPLWFPHSLVESLDKLYLPKLAAFRFNLWQLGLSFKLPILILIEVGLVLIFITGNLGTRAFGYLSLFKNFVKNKLSNFDILAIFMQLFGIILPLLFIQKGTTWNTIQFFYYVLVFANFYLAKYLGRLWEKRKLILLFIVLLLTIPTTYSTLGNYLGYPPPSGLPLYELQALTQLEELPGNVVLTYPYDSYTNLKLQTPIPIYLYETTAYVSAFSGKTSYVEDEINLEITGYPWQERVEKSREFFSTYDKIWARGFLINNKIDYIYLVDDQKLPLSNQELGVKKIYDRKKVKIYKVLK